MKSLFALLTVLVAASIVRAAPTPAPAMLFQQRDGLTNVLAKLQTKQQVRIAFLGGSITAANGWRPKTKAWFQRLFPGTGITEINAAISGTGSDLGVYRYQQDVLSQKPDLVFVEFSVNDGGAKPEDICRGMEGIVRQTWRADPSTDICFVYTFRVGYEQYLRQNLCAPAPSADEMVADHYGIPSINLALRISQMEEEGVLIFKAATPPEKTPDGKLIFSNDGIHPLNGGHEIYAGTIESIVTFLPRDAVAKPHTLSAPLMADNWEGAHLVPLSAGKLSPGWSRVGSDSPENEQFGKFLPEVWKTTTPGESFTFRFKGTAAGIYDISGPDGGQVAVTLDGVRSQPMARFDHYASHLRLTTLPIGAGLPDTVHTVKIELLPEQPDRRVVTDTESQKPGYDPKLYDGTVLRFGSIMVIGDVVE